MKTAVPLADKPFLRIREAASLYSKSPTTIYEAIYSGKLPYIVQGKGYRLERKDVDEWMRRGAPR